MVRIQVKLKINRYCKDAFDLLNIQDNGTVRLHVHNKTVDVKFEQILIETQDIFDTTMWHVDRYWQMVLWYFLFIGFSWLYWFPQTIQYSEIQFTFKAKNSPGADLPHDPRIVIIDPGFGGAAGSTVFSALEHSVGTLHINSSETDWGDSTSVLAYLNRVANIATYFINCTIGDVAFNLTNYFSNKLGLNNKVI